MSLAALIVRIGADTSDLDRGLSRANRNVEQFGRKLRPMGASLTRIGNSASMAAGSLSRLGGVMPGVVGGMGRVVGTLGTAGIVLGETTILAAGLTKGMRLLQAASTAVAASSAPAWLASLATPAGIAIAAVAALAAATYGLAKAWDAVKQSQKGTRVGNLAPGVSKVEWVDVQGRAKPWDQMTGGAHVLEPVVAGTGKQLSDAGIEINLARQAVEAWGQAVDGIRPLTEAMGKQWDVARDSIVSALSDTSRYTEEAKKQLYDMLAALKMVRPALSSLPPLPKVGVTPRGLQPLGDPAPLNVPLPPSPGIGATLGQMAQSGAGAAGGMVAEMMQGIAMFGPLGAVMPVITSAFQALAPILEPLVPIIDALGQIIAVSLTPVIKFVVTGLSYLAEAVGWVIRGIGRLVDALPGISAKGVINAGQAMIDAARAARRNADATDNATDKVNEFAGALSNIPRVFNVEALRHLVGAGSSNHGGGPGGGVPPGTGGRPMLSVVGSIEIVVNGATDPIKTAEAIGREMDRRFSRGGTSRLAVSLV